MTAATDARRARRRAPLEPPTAAPGDSSRGRRTDDGTTSSGFGTVVAAVTGGARLTASLLLDSRVPSADRLAAIAALAYLVVPMDLIPDLLPVLGQLDDLGVVLWAWRRLVAAAGQDVVTDRWRGDPRALRLVLAFAGLG